VGTGETFLAALAEIPSDERMLYLRHEIRRGETLARISRRYGTTVAAIQQANSMGRSTLIREGKRLLIPTTGAADPGLFMGSLAAQGEQVSHRLRRGETLSHVARAYGTTVKAIQLWNHIGDPHQVREGESLVVYAGVQQASPKNQTDAARTPRPTARATQGDLVATQHTVQRGQNLWSIARSYGMTLAEIRALNPSLARVIHPGDRLTVHARSDGESLVHEVMRGETLWDIADRYNTTVANIRSWNNMSGSSSLIRPGDRLTVFR
jgi:membrane-bound lytic murein transglycosylase D